MFGSPGLQFVYTTRSPVTHSHVPSAAASVAPIQKLLPPSLSERSLLSAAVVMMASRPPMLSQLAFAADHESGAAVKTVKP